MINFFHAEFLDVEGRRGDDWIFYFCYDRDTQCCHYVNTDKQITFVVAKQLQ
jgi:hypothetical protein